MRSIGTVQVTADSVQVAAHDMHISSERVYVTETALPSAQRSSCVALICCAYRFIGLLDKTGLVGAEDICVP